jgi:hypothetical protein
LLDASYCASDRLSASSELVVNGIIPYLAEGLVVGDHYSDIPPTPLRDKQFTYLETLNEAIAKGSR